MPIVVFLRPLGLRLVVGTFSVVGVIVDGGVWLLGSNVWSQQPGIEKGEKREAKKP